MMNESRYKLKGPTQRKGTEGTSRQMWLVVANSSTEAKAGKSSQSSRWVQVGAGPALAGSSAADGERPGEACLSRAVRQQAVPHNSQNSTKPPLHHRLCCRPSHSGSTTNGYV